MTVRKSRAPLLLGLLLVLLLSGCAGQLKPEAEDMPAPVAELVKQNDDLSLAEEEKVAPTMEDLKIMALEAVLPNGEGNQENGLAGYRLDCSGLELTCEREARFLLTVSRNGVAREVPAIVTFDGDRLGAGETQKYGNLAYGWGGLYAAAEGQIALVTQEAIQFWNSETLADTGLVIAAEEGVFFRGLAWHQALGYMVPTLQEGEEWVRFYSEQGVLTGSKKLDTRGHGISAGALGTGERAGVVTFRRNMGVLELDEPLLVLYDDSWLTLFDPLEGLVWNMNRYDTVQEREIRLELLTSSLWSSGFLPYGRARSGLALLYEGDELAQFMYFDASELPAGEAGEGWLENGVYYSRQALAPPFQSGIREDLQPEEAPAFSMRLSVKEQLFEWEYELDKTVVYELLAESTHIIAQSPNGRYQVAEVLREGGGDGYQGQWVVYDTTEQKLRHLYKSGTLPFAAQEAVFLSESLVGVVCNDGAYFYRADTGERLDIALDMPFGQTKDTGMTDNQLISLCASGDLAYYAVLYLSKDVDIFWMDEEYTHRAALFDREGRLLADVETEIPMYRKIYTTYHPEIALEGTVLTVYSPQSDEAFIVNLAY